MMLLAVAQWATLVGLLVVFTYFDGAYYNDDAAGALTLTTAVIRYLEEIFVYGSMLWIVYHWRSVSCRRNFDEVSSI